MSLQIGDANAVMYYKTVEMLHGGIYRYKLQVIHELKLKLN